MCVYPSWAVSMPLCIRPARVGCLQKSLGSKEFSQHRHRSFRLVIASLQIRPTAQTRAQHVPRVCRVIPCPILLVRASCIACHGSTAQQQSAFTLEYIVPYCRCVRDVPTLKMRVVLFLVCIKNSTISSKNDHCCILVQVACFFGG